MMTPQCKELMQEINKLCDGKSPLDVGPALIGMLSGVICQTADDYEMAVELLDGSAKAIRTSLQKHFGRTQQ
jgi:hypothetical protein